MATVLLLRHGRTAANADGTLAGRSSVGLDDPGLAQAKAAGERLAGLPLGSVVSSPLQRCLQTVAEALPTVQPVIEPGLIECGYGDWEGQTLKSLAKDPLWRVVQQHPSAVTFPARVRRWRPCRRGLSRRCGRMTSGCDAEHGDGALWLACSHGDVIKAIVADALGLHLDLFQRHRGRPGLGDGDPVHAWAAVRGAAQRHRRRARVVGAAGRTRRGRRGRTAVSIIGRARRRGRRTRRPARALRYGTSPTRRIGF